MATVPATGYRIIKRDRRYEDYKSMKQWYSGNHVKEIIFSGSQDSAVTSRFDASDLALNTLITAEEVVFLATSADAGALQDLKSVWVTYQDDTGAIHGPIEHLLNDTVDTSAPAPLGNEDIFDTVNGAPVGDVITFTALAATADQYAGWYTIGRSGNGDQIGVANLIISNTAHATAPEFTLTDTPDANTDTDVIQIQQYPCNDFYRLREMYCEVEPDDDNQIELCDFNGGEIYYVISEGGRYYAGADFFTQPIATCRSFIGRIKARAANVLEAAAADSGQVISVTFTPIAANTNGESADITMSFQFTNEFNWEPCIELEPATDVLIAITDTTTATAVHVEATYLEVYPS